MLRIYGKKNYRKAANHDFDEVVWVLEVFSGQ